MKDPIEVPLGTTPSMAGSSASNKNPVIIEPGIGIDDSCYYVAEVAMNTSNPVHRVILHSGFWPKGGYRTVWAGSYERPYDVREFVYIKILFKIDCIGGDPEEVQERVNNWRAT